MCACQRSLLEHTFPKHLFSTFRARRDRSTAATAQCGFVQGSRCSPAQPGIAGAIDEATGPQLRATQRLMTCQDPVICCQILRTSLAAAGSTVWSCFEDTAPGRWVARILQQAGLCFSGAMHRSGLPPPLECATLLTHVPSHALLALAKAENPTAAAP